MKKQTYQQPLIELSEVSVEQGIASSQILYDTSNDILNMEEGTEWGVYTE